MMYDAESVKDQKPCIGCGAIHESAWCPYYGELGSEMTEEEMRAAARRILEDKAAGVWPFPLNPEEKMKLMVEQNIFGYYSS